MPGLFIIGQGRSGTTALVEVVGAHGKVVLGIERYRDLAQPERISELVPALYERDAFFDFEGHPFTSITPAVPRYTDYFANAARKWDEAVYVGDKLGVPWALPTMLERFPDARFLCIVRDVREVAASWEVRAKDAEDHGWGQNRDGFRAVTLWSASLRQITAARLAEPDRVLVVDYGAFFSRPDDVPLRRVMRFLDLPVDEPVLAKYHDAKLIYAERVAGKSRALSPELEAFVQEKIKPYLWKQVLRA